MCADKFMNSIFPENEGLHCFFFFVFFLKLVLTFHANCLLRRHFV